MKRQIKFRWWDEDEKVMVNDIAIHPEYSWLVLADNDAMAESSYKNGVLMQYTGLLDKNGKEIYEGDILQFLDHSGDTDTLANRVVVFAGGAFGVLTKKIWLGLFQLLNELKCEVIGNVYQDSHLLVSKHRNKV